MKCMEHLRVFPLPHEEGLAAGRDGGLLSSGWRAASRGGCELGGAVTQAAVRFGKQSRGRESLVEQWRGREQHRGSRGRELHVVLKGGRDHATEARLRTLTAHNYVHAGPLVAYIKFGATPGFWRFGMLSPAGKG